MFKKCQGPPRSHVSDHVSQITPRSLILAEMQLHHEPVCQAHAAVLLPPSCCRHLSWLPQLPGWLHDTGSCACQRWGGGRAEQGCAAWLPAPQSAQGVRMPSPTQACSRRGSRGMQIHLPHHLATRNETQRALPARGSSEQRVGSYPRCAAQRG